MFSNYKMKLNIFILFFFMIQSIVAQEQNTDLKKKSTLAATLLGFIPGAGHFYLGDYKTGGKFAATTGLLIASASYLGSSGNILRNTNIAFNPELTLLANEFEEKNYLYQTEEEFQENPLPRLLFGLKLEKEREFRLLKNGQYFPLGILDDDYDIYLYEMNPLIKYGNYSRQNKETIIHSNVSNGLLVDSVYSSYAAYRDSGAYEDSNKQKETFIELASAPFHLSYFTKWELLLPVIISSINNFSVSAGNRNILVPYGEKNYPYVNVFFNQSMYAAVWEESFYRGILDHSLSKKIGSTPAALTSAFLFGISHSSAAQIIYTPILGLYFSWIFRKYNYDIKPAVFIHFWINFLGGLSDFHRQKNPSKIIESPYAEMDNRQVHSMPIVFYTKAF